MKIAFVYAGQGSQKVGMGKDLYEKYPVFKNCFDILSEDMKQLCFNGPEEILSQTSNTQPCMVAFAVGVTEMFRANNIFPEMTAGLSLGEYSALYCSGVFSAEQAVNLAAFRGKIMSQASQGIHSKMTAILNLDRESVAECCAEGQKAGIAEIANYNCPGQIVISGDKEGVDRAAALALEKGAKRCIPLSVSGPFHTSLMKPAGDRLRLRLEEEKTGILKIPVIFNATARPLQEGETVEELLERQIQESVRFEDTIKYMELMGVDTIIEIGPGRALSSFIRKTTRNMRVFAAEDVNTFEMAVSALIKTQEEL